MKTTVFVFFLALSAPACGQSTMDPYSSVSATATSTMVVDTMPSDNSTSADNATSMPVTSPPVSVAETLNITLTLLSKDETSANISVDFMGGAPQFVKMAGSTCHDGNSSLSPNATECVIDAPVTYEMHPIVVSLTGLVPGNTYTFSSGPVNYNLSNGTADVASFDIITFCTVPNAPANITAAKGMSWTEISYSVIASSVGVVGGYKVTYEEWNGTMFNDLGNATGGTISGLVKATLYRLTAFAKSECYPVDLSPGNATVYYVTGVDAPMDSDITRIHKDSTKMCFIWNYTSADTFNTIKMELIQSSASKGVQTMTASMGPGVICVDHSSLVTNSEAQAQFAVGNIITAEGMSYEKYSYSTNKTVNTTDFKLLVSYQTNCTDNVENCTVVATIDQLVNDFINYTTVDLTYTSGSNVNETRMLGLTDPAECVGNSTTDLTCTLVLTGLNLTEYEFDVHVVVHGVEIYHLELSRGGETKSSATRWLSMWITYLLAMILAINMAHH